MARGDQPYSWQLEELAEFCSCHNNICLIGEQQKISFIQKYLKMCGTVLSAVIPFKDETFSFDAESDATRFDGYILAVDDGYENKLLKQLSDLSVALSDIYIIGQHNQKTIAHKMTPRKRENFLLEVNLADHCNLNCQMCDHFSQLAQPSFIDMDVFKRDMERMAELTENHIWQMRLQGGEPLLNEDLPEAIRITRRLFPDTIIFLVTNGLLLKDWETNHKENLWEVCHDNGIWIEMTLYPIGMDVDGLRTLASKYDVKLDIFSEMGARDYTGVKHSKKQPFKLGGSVERWEFIGCYQFNECMVLKKGKIYSCPVAAYIGYFNEEFNQNLAVSKDDMLDIYQIAGFEEIAEFSSHSVPFCRYCDISGRRDFEWTKSKRSIEEYVDL